ncbi:tRNA-splicing endonuclease subunit SEN54 [Streptomyces misionensis JCM 4497]
MVPGGPHLQLAGRRTRQARTRPLPLHGQADGRRPGALRGRGGLPAGRPGGRGGRNGRVRVHRDDTRRATHRRHPTVLPHGRVGRPADMTRATGECLTSVMPTSGRSFLPAHPRPRRSLGA